jgi:hypothetical protein
MILKNSKTLEIAVLLNAVVISLLLQQASILCLSLIWLATRILFPRHSPLLYWPIGLLLLLVASQVFFSVLWSVGSLGVSRFSSTLAVLCFTTIGAMVFIWRLKNEQKDPGLRSDLSIIISIPALLIIIWATWRLSFQPTLLINQHMSGGDHANHVGFSYQMISSINHAPLPSPWTFSGYPHSLHFFVANLSTLSMQRLENSVFSTVFRYAAWMDIIQFAAVLQMTALLATKYLISFRIRAAIIALATVLVLISVPGFVSHVLLSGFSTSLNSQWVLLAFIFGTQIQSKNYRFLVIGIASLLMISVYQLLLLPIVAYFIIFPLHESLLPMTHGYLQRYASLIYGLLFGVTVYVLGVTIGANSNFVRTLVLDGAVLRPNIRLFVLLTLVNVLMSVLNAHNADEDDSQSWFRLHSIVASSIGLILGLWLTSSSVTSTSLSDPPYYVKKLIWLGIGILIPVLVLQLTKLFVLTMFRRRSSSVSAVSIASILILSLVFNYGENPATKMLVHDNRWFVNKMESSNFRDVANKSVAINGTDQFGSHLINVSLSQLSPEAHLFDLELLRDFSNENLCRSITALEIRVVFIQNIGITELVNSGCPSEGISYIS